METTIKRDTVAKEIMKQIGGNKMRAMVGARDFTYDENSLTFKFKMFSKANCCKITLNSLDLYDIEFLQIRKHKGLLGVETFESYSNIYNDQLISTFEEVTGLYTRLF